MTFLQRAVLCLVLLGSVPPAQAGGPVFDEMPRWDDGWGFQVVQHYRHRRGLLVGTETVDSDLSEHAAVLHIDGVYTWDRSIRITGELPVVLYAVETRRDAAGEVVEETEIGFGDATVALPLKRYYNLDGRSGSFSLVPKLRAPLGAKDDYSVYWRAWGAGLAAGVETETYRFHGNLGLTAWHYFGQRPNHLEANVGTGLNIHALGSSGHFKVKGYLDYEGDGSTRVRAGTILYWRFSDLIHGQVTWKMDVYNWRGTPKLGNEHNVSAGVGFVY